LPGQPGGRENAKSNKKTFNPTASFAVVGFFFCETVGLWGVLRMEKNQWRPIRFIFDEEERAFGFVACLYWTELPVKSPS